MWVHARMRACMRVCVYACVRVCVYACVRVCARARLRIRVFVRHMHLCVHMRAWRHMRVNTCSCARHHRKAVRVIVMAHIVIAFIVMASPQSRPSHSYGTYSYGLYSYGLTAKPSYTIMAQIVMAYIVMASPQSRPNEAVRRRHPSRCGTCERASARALACTPTRTRIASTYCP